MNKVYRVNVQYRLSFVQKERSQRVNEGQLCIVAWHLLSFNRLFAPTGEIARERMRALPVISYKRKARHKTR